AALVRPLDLADELLLLGLLLFVEVLRGEDLDFLGRVLFLADWRGLCAGQADQQGQHQRSQHGRDPQRERTAQRGILSATARPAASRIVRTITRAYNGVASPAPPSTTSIHPRRVGVHA